MSGAVIRCLRHINNISNSYLVRNADVFLSQKEVEVPVDWIGDQKKGNTKPFKSTILILFWIIYLSDEVWFIIF